MQSPEKRHAGNFKRRLRKKQTAAKFGKIMRPPFGGGNALNFVHMQKAKI
jgi:hypothetical protein